MQKKPSTRNPTETRQKLITAAVGLMLQQGYAGTSVDQICSAAGLTKGSFFHYFDSKEAICRAAVDWWGEFGTALYDEAWKDPEMDPLEQLHRFFDIMIGFNERPDQACVCMVGMMSQELSGINPAMRELCETHLQKWVEPVIRVLRAAQEKHPVKIPFEPEEVAWFLNSLWQGSMLIGKTRLDQQMTISNLKLARAWVDHFFDH